MGAIAGAEGGLLLCHVRLQIVRLALYAGLGYNLM
jgi:hypothetical protein